MESRQPSWNVGSPDGKQAAQVENRQPRWETSDPGAKYVAHVQKQTAQMDSRPVAWVESSLLDLKARGPCENQVAQVETCGLGGK